MGASVRDFPLFAVQALRNPVAVMAIAPSSSALAREMVAGIGPETGAVVELGPGTGRITRALLDQGVARDRLTLLERNPAFSQALSERYPGLRVETRDAQDLGLMGLPDQGAVVSGLPLLSMSRASQQAIVGGAFAVLRPGGVFVQFTYGPQPPVAASVVAALGLSVTRSRRIWGNLPPARVYVYRQGRNGRGSGF